MSIGLVGGRAKTVVKLKRKESSIAHHEKQRNKSQTTKR